MKILWLPAIAAAVMLSFGVWELTDSAPGALFLGLALINAFIAVGE